MPRRLRRRLGNLRDAARNAAELVRHGRLGAPYHAAFEEIERTRTHRLRRYSAADGALRGEVDPILLVPPLMVSSEVYDVSPELSSVGFLTRVGIEVWLVDFGAPEREEGGLARTLDDHVLAVDASIARVRRESGRPVHVGGYSQGGMFAYQAAAYRRCADVASLVTFGSPVDVRKMFLPVKVADPVVERVLRWVRAGIDAPLEGLEGLPGTLTSTGFKLFSARKELEQIGTFFRNLHDREALARREPARKFLGGEGFVAWPGPAFKEFVDQLVVENRLAKGGLVVAGRTVSLADLTVPVLYFVGTNDEMARPPSVRAIRKAAPEAELHEVVVPAGHFGLVVGSRALQNTWPTVAEWIAWRAGVGEKPARLAEAPVRPREEEAATDASSLYELSIHAMDGLWGRLGEASVEVAGLLHALRWEIPRLSRLESLGDTDAVGMGRALREQAAAIPDETFFLWQGRAFSWRTVDERVDRLVDALVADGVRRGDEVRLAMRDHPDHLVALAALNRLGAVAIVAPPDAEGGLDVAVLLARDVPGARVDRDGGRAVEVAMVLEEVPSASGLARRERVRITNRRLATSGLVTAGACQLTPRDTLLCALPLHHPLAILVAGGGALIGGCRLALADGPGAFWAEARRAGATVGVYDGPFLRALAAAPARKGEDRHGLRLLVGSGADAETWEIVRGRFGRVRILEFHAMAGGAAVLANLEGKKPGSIGRPFPGSAWLAIVRTGPDGSVLRDRSGRAVRCEPDEVGLVLARVEPGRALGAEDLDGELLADVFVPGDAWVATGDRLRRDADGDWWR